MNLTKWIGIPYGMHEPSLDCWGLCRKFSEQELGIILPEFFWDKTDEEAYLEAGKIHILSELNMGIRWRKAEEPTLGDIVLMRIKGYPVHCGIFLGNVDGRQSFLHTLRGRNSSIESLTFWGQQINAIYRHISIA